MKKLNVDIENLNKIISSIQTNMKDNENLIIQHYKIVNDNLRNIEKTF